MIIHYSNSHADYNSSRTLSTVRTSRSLYFNERRHFTSAVGRKEEEEEEERRRRRRKEKERRAREEKERGDENATKERMQRRRRSIDREDRSELRGDVTYDRKRERAREEEREGMYNSGSAQSFHKTSCGFEAFEGNLPKSEANIYTLPPHEFQQPESLHSDCNGEKSIDISVLSLHFDEWLASVIIHNIIFLICMCKFYIKILTKGWQKSPSVIRLTRANFLKEMKKCIQPDEVRIPIIIVIIISMIITTTSTIIIISMIITSIIIIITKEMKMCNQPDELQITYSMEAFYKLHCLR